eukprot:CAMPEP_0171860104 /NCGR_PEP_ID=MMETSP0992-20121227/26291_1 /TAXON_ID=483369 /ORGANISM="non described non described, Strain CCMP2098" /LENGTH=165 /DNA_ID=CAMNT_0012481877 /DNA_START=15 /DNA_END=511 /DNA_ORIENTATION=+
MPPTTSATRFTKEQIKQSGFTTPPKLSSIDDRSQTPLGARFDPGKSFRKNQAYRFKIGDSVEVRDDIFSKKPMEGRGVKKDSGGNPFPWNECRMPLLTVEEQEEQEEVEGVDEAGVRLLKPPRRKPRKADDPDDVSEHPQGSCSDKGSGGSKRKPPPRNQRAATD